MAVLVSCDEWRTGRKAHKQGRWLPGMFLWLPGKFLAEHCPHRKGSVAAGGSPPPPCARSNLSRPFSRALKRLFICRQLKARVLSVGNFKSGPNFLVKHILIHYIHAAKSTPQKRDPKICQLKYSSTVIKF